MKESPTSQQLFWKCAKREDGLVVGSLRLIVKFGGDERTRYFAIHLDVLGRDLVLLDEAQKKEVVKVNDRAALPPSSTRTMTWACGILDKLLGYYRPIYFQLPPNIECGALEGSLVIDAAEEQFLWELAEQP